MFLKNRNLEAVENVVIPGRGIYTGQIKKLTNNNFVMQGYGVLVMKSGQKYEGNWLNNMYSDKGKLWISDSHYYDGEWKNGK